MRVLLDGRWQDGFLDYWKAPDEYRLRVLAWRNLEELDQLYFVRHRSWRLIVNYLREVGPVEVARKVSSRVAERQRNQKYVSCGIGRVLETPTIGAAAFFVDTLVAFIAPSHPPCVERIALPEGLLAPLDPDCVPSVARDVVLYRAPDQTPSPELRFTRGWSRYAGLSAPILLDDEARALVRAVTDRTAWTQVQRLPAGADAGGERAPASSARRDRRAARAAVLFGYGNYAKTTILPNVRKVLDVACIHEVDPTQAPATRRRTTAWDTAPLPRDDDAHAVHLIAGYHGTHAHLAVRALEGGADAVVEKPIAVTDDQLADLLAAMERSQGRLFSCYQRRYSPLTKVALDDLARSGHTSISYHCIVYEVPLPELHWYRWPSSGSRLLSNGCHWIDHFLYLNDFGEVTSSELWCGPDGALNCCLGLENGASFTMVLTDHGSPRIGVHDHVELRSGDITATLVNNSSYRAEGATRVLRRKRVAKAVSYKLMYREIARRLNEGGPGDSVRSVRSSAGTVLALERQLREWPTIAPANIDRARLGGRS